MARQLKSNKKHETGRTITTKSPYGTHSDMVVSDDTIISQYEVGAGQVLAQDDAGYYVTYSNRVDSGLADPLRYNRWFYSD